MEDVPRTVNGTGHTGPSEFCAIAAGRRKIRRRKRLKPSRKEEMHTKKQLLILIKSMMTESDTWTLVSETSSRVGELT